MKTSREWLEVGFGGMALFFVAMVLAIVVPRRVDHDVWDILTALGTVGATAAAVWLGLRQEMIRRRDEKIRAALIAARVGPGLARLLAAIDSLMAEASLKADGGNWSSVEILGHARALRSPAKIVSALDIVSLTPLASNAALQLARGVSLTRLVRIEMCERGPDFDREDFVANQLYEIHLTRWMHALSEAKELLEAAERECERTAKLVIH